MINVSEFRNCFGCGACTVSCPKKIIDIRLDRNGFYEPVITNSSDCIKCGACLKVCSFYNAEDKLLVEEPIGYATWSLNSNIRRSSSSGGTGYEIVRFLIESGYIFCGVKYDAENGKAVHYFAENIDELKLSQGSKYIQSFTVDAFKTFNFNVGKYVVVGTPCQIASLHRIIERKKAQDRFILIDFFCHGVPSMFLWKKYCSYAEGKIGKIKEVSWRNKQAGWHDSWNMFIKGEEGTCNSRMSKGDLFYKYFLGHHCIGYHCTSNCRFKMTKSYADIRIGDLWGNTFKSEDNGVTGVLALTQKGKNVLASVPYIYKEKAMVETVCEGQMKTNAHSHPLRKLTLSLMRSSLSLVTIDRLVSIFEFPLKVLRKIHLLNY